MRLARVDLGEDLGEARIAAQGATCCRQPHSVTQSPHAEGGLAHPPTGSDRGPTPRSRLGRHLTHVYSALCNCFTENTAACMSAGAGKVETSLARQCWEHPPFFVMLFFGNRERAALRTLLYHVDSAGPAASHLLPCLARELNSWSRLAVMSATTSLEWALECLCHAADADPAAWPQVYMYILAVASSYTNRHIKNTVWIMPVRDPLTVLHHATPRELVTVIDSPPHARSTQSDPCSTQHVNYLPAGIRLRRSPAGRRIPSCGKR